MTKLEKFLEDSLDKITPDCVIKNMCPPQVDDNYDYCFNYNSCEDCWNLEAEEDENKI